MNDSIRSSLVSQSRTLICVAIMGLTSLPTSTGPELRAGRALLRAEHLRLEWKEESIRKAIQKYEIAQKESHNSGNIRQELVALQQTAKCYFILSEYDDALRCLNEALGLARANRYQVAETQIMLGIGETFLDLADSERAREPLNSALALSRELNDRQSEAMALNDLGTLEDIRGNSEKALKLYEGAMTIWKEIGDQAGQAETLLNLGYTIGNEGYTVQSEDYYNQALTIWRTEKNRFKEALTLTAIGTAHAVQGRYETALNLQREAEQLLEVMGNRGGRAAALNSSGSIYLSLDDQEKALACYEQAKKLFQDCGNKHYEGITLGYIGQIYHRKKEFEKALEYYDQRLSLSREIKDHRMETFTMLGLAEILFESGPKERVLELYNNALSLSEKFGDRRATARTFDGLGNFYEAAGHQTEALRHYGRALMLFREIEDRNSEIRVLYGIGRVERDLGKLESARTHVKDCLDMIESLRANVLSHQLRSSYLAKVSELYELYVDILMRLHQKNPSKGLDAVAFNTSERVRARSFLDMLIEAQIDIRQGVDQKLLESEQGLLRQFNRRLQDYQRQPERQITPDIEASFRRDQRKLEEQLDRVRSDIKLNSPSYAEMTQPAPLNMQEIRSRILDADTILLEFLLGDQCSYLWVVTKKRFFTFKLPPRRDIARDVWQLYELLAPGDLLVDTDADRARASVSKSLESLYSVTASRLSKSLLGQAAPLLKNKRLLIVADKDMQYLNFGALPAPGLSDGENDSNRPLFINHEVINLPSASSFAVQRQEIQNRTSAPKTLAVLADPVFRADDIRVAQSHRGEFNANLIEHEVRDQVIKLRSGSLYQRLAGSWKEAQTILQYVSEGDYLEAVGFDASLETATSEKLKDYRIIHFATHGILNNFHPQLSSLVLSLVDQDGKEKDGFLQLHHVQNLKLRADLVVLSGCQTALGKNLRAEGLVGLSRGFMQAGAATVVASLWKIEDNASVRLMDLFYRGILKEHLRPAAALREAQKVMFEEGCPPSQWAAFIIQGEWK
ncbi:MAG: CHAT domain-containing tetratricopeptide repeat protein [Blastocatellia bacterium]